ncbi:alpha/beta fold hydrolase [Haloarchaeobius sp. HME9146]|uniref:alpha/beta hydrolase n=1 Tax=Haloarchaeobius sp. HME9146 TaxID=2978732 RepID=UPI0021BF73D6|nr:alpha/beta fold hydrolase [Haloarchaeobius sp. HME9146]MCT9095748.1 alpha/beta fold hydrolase [Haloarchaeobius sp. HME9146]
MDDALPRRRILRALAATGTVALAGCSGGGAETETTTRPGTDTTLPTGTPTATDTGTTRQPTTEALSPEELTTRARELTLDLGNGAYDSLTDEFVGQAAEQVSADVLRQAWTTQTSGKGEFTGIASADYAEQNGVQLVVVRATFQSGVLLVNWAFDDAGGVVGLRLNQPSSAWGAPEYADQSSFTESELTLPSPACDLGATLSMPTGSGQVPGVVLVHGSGPNDRDETVGPNKVFKDLAWGLASQGIAVLRYDKRTFACEVVRTDATIDAVTVDDAVTAIDRLAAEDRIADVTVVGHSLGGLAAPRIATRADVARVVMLAAPHTPLWRLIPEQVRYLAELDETVSDAERAQIEQFDQAADRIAAGEFSDDDSLMGFPGTFWRSLTQYDHVAAAQALSVPTLLAQGERDYQVPPSELDAWAGALTRETVSFRSFAALNHLLMPGEGPANPSEYFTQNHVGVDLVAEVAEFVAGSPARVV